MAGQMLAPVPHASCSAKPLAESYVELPTKFVPGLVTRRSFSTSHCLDQEIKVG